MIYKQHKNIFAIVGLMIFAGVLAILGSGKAYASDSPISLQVSPTKQKLELKPGDSYSSSFEVMNIGTGNFSYFVSATPYWVADETYSAKYDVKNNYTQIADWVTFDQSTETGTLAPGETRKVYFTVNVPYDVPAGGQYATLMAQTEDGNDNDANIQVVNRVGMVLYADVAGDTREEGKILKNGIPMFVLNPPLAVTSLIENTGNVEATAKFTLKIWSLFSNETVYNNEDNPGTADILPDTKRATTIRWDGAPHIGIFKVEQTIEFLGKTSTSNKIVVFCPLWLIILILALIVFLIFKVKSRKKK